MCLVAECTDDTQYAKGGEVEVINIVGSIEWGIDRSCRGDYRRDNEVVGIKEFC
jgi:hypothetical protein